MPHALRQRYPADWFGWDFGVSIGGKLFKAFVCLHWVAYTNSVLGLCLEISVKHIENERNQSDHDSFSRSRLFGANEVRIRTAAHCIRPIIFNSCASHFIYRFSPHFIYFLFFSHSLSLFLCGSLLLALSPLRIRAVFSAAAEIVSFRTLFSRKLNDFQRDWPCLFLYMVRLHCSVRSRTHSFAAWRSFNGRLPNECLRFPMRNPSICTRNRMTFIRLRTVSLVAFSSAIRRQRPTKSVDSSDCFSLRLFVVAVCISFVSTKMLTPITGPWVCTIFFSASIATAHNVMTADGYFNNSLISASKRFSIKIASDFIAILRCSERFL